MTGVNTVRVGDTSQIDYGQKSNESFPESHQSDFCPSILNSTVLTISLAAFSLFGSYQTVGIDTMRAEIIDKDSTITVPVYDQIIGKPISRVEALKLAKQILERAEQRRIESAEKEAEIGLQFQD